MANLDLSVTGYIEVLSFGRLIGSRWSSRLDVQSVQPLIVTIFRVKSASSFSVKNFRTRSYPASGTRRPYIRYDFRPGKASRLCPISR